jgi:hypothetical protein
VKERGHAILSTIGHSQRVKVQTNPRKTRRRHPRKGMQPVWHPGKKRARGITALTLIHALSYFAHLSSLTIFHLLFILKA